MSNLKKTEIHVRGYDSNFIVILEKDYFVSLEQSIAWVHTEIVDTAMVLKVVQKWQEGDLVIHNMDQNVAGYKFNVSNTVRTYEGKINTPIIK